MRSVVLGFETDWDGWRRATRDAVLAGVPPEQIVWSVGQPTELFAAEPAAPADTVAASAASAAAAGATFNVPRALVALAETVILAREPERFALLYRLVWRAHAGERQLIEKTTDPEVYRAERLARSVRRDMHKMRAFLRFRVVEEPAGRRYVGWFEPDHHIVEANAPFFVRRFATMHWSILTPDCCVHWDGETLRASPGASAAEVPDDDALEAFWRTYFSAIFNPARLKVAAMTSEMPKKYWRNLPEVRAIPTLIRQAADRTDAMLEQELRAPPSRTAEPGTTEQGQLGPVRPASRAGGAAAAEGDPLAALAHEAEACRRCPLWEPATQTVFGEGPAAARIVFVGEQPGDQEDLVGRPFVGPAGQLLDRALEEAGVDRRAAYVTNAVKHFKFTPRGKRRIHQKPETPEIVACKVWLDRELAAIEPDLLVMLGATAARAVLGRAVTIGRERGRRIDLADGGAGFVTVHPSFLLRLPDVESKEREYRAFVADLRAAAALAAQIGRAAA